MSKKFMQYLLIIALVNLGLTINVYTQQIRTTKETKLLEKVKKGIKKIGTGQDTKVSVRLKDGSRIVGSVKDIRDDEFTVTDGNGDDLNIAYSDVKRLGGKKLSQGAWVAIGFGIGAAAFLTGLWLWIENNG